MFKRRTWDSSIKADSDRLYSDVEYQDRYGFRKIDYAFRNASWHIEYEFAKGNLCSDSGLYSWTKVSEKVQRFIEKGERVSSTPEDNARLVKTAARAYGASLVGICNVHPNLIYSHELDLVRAQHRPISLPQSCTQVIVLAVEMDYELCRYSPDGIAGAATGLGYSKQAVLANLVATFIRGLGFEALPSGNDTALSVPLAIAAGLGEGGRNGLLVTEKFGPRVRICKVFTNLPMEIDDFRPFGVRRFCASCKKCAKKCPSQAIPFEEPTTEGPSNISNHSGIRKWYVDPEKCFLFWTKNRMDCKNCISVCPFNKPPGYLHDTARRIIGRWPVFNRAMVWLDDVFGYGKPVSAASKIFWEKTI
jgi:reductive dehalogenase